MPKCRSEARRSDVPYGHASMLLLGEGREATEPYNKYEPLQINEVPYTLAVTALILFRFKNRLFCLVLKSSILSRIPIFKCSLINFYHKSFQPPHKFQSSVFSSVLVEKRWLCKLWYQIQQTVITIKVIETAEAKQ